MEKIAIVTDSNSGITAENARQYGIWVVPMIFYVGGNEYKEGISLTEETFFAGLERGDDVTTSQPSIKDLKELWDGLLQEHEKIIHIPMSKMLSGGYAAAAAISEDYGGRVLVVDSRRISVTQASMAFHAKMLSESGMSAAEIKRKLEEDALAAGIYITVDSLEYLKKGGRISGITAMAGELLNIKPVLQIQGNLIEEYGKVRGRKKAKKMIEDALRNDWEILSSEHGAEKLHFYVAHAGVEEEASEWAGELEKLFPGYKVGTAKLPMNVCCHVGPGTIGAAVCLN